MAELNLDRYREEHAGEAHKVTLGGKVYQFPAKLPILVPEFLQRGQVLAALELLVGDDALEVGMQLNFDMEGGDFEPILKELYGIEPPESSASSESSPSNGARPRQTSAGSTGSTSPKRAGVTPN